MPSCFNTQPPEGGWVRYRQSIGSFEFSFNTQPPEGGWVNADRVVFCFDGFNTQPPEGGWRRAMF